MSRIRLSRAAGGQLPPEARSVAWPTRWANPYRPAARSLEANAQVVELYRAWVAERLAAERQERAPALLPVQERTSANSLPPQGFNRRAARTCCWSYAVATSGAGAGVRNRGGRLYPAGKRRRTRIGETEGGG